MFPVPHPAFAKTYGIGALPYAEAAAPIDLRLAGRSDAGSLIRLAQLDSALAAAGELPGRAGEGDVLIAESGGEPIAALSISDGLLVSDPSHRTTELISLLHTRRRQIRRAERRGRLRPGVLRPRHL
jgi:hypothetical protein